MRAVKTKNNYCLLFVFASASVNMEKNKVSTKQQLDRLVDLVKKNPNIGRGKRIYGTRRDEINKTWDKYADELNSLGPPTRTATEWQRVWIHYKANLKRKLARTKEHLETNAGRLGAFHEISLSATEEKAFEITQMDFSFSTNEFIDVSDERIKTPSPPAAESSLIAGNTEQPTTKPAKTTVAQLELLKAMAGKQNEMLRTLRNMQSTQHKLYQLKLEKLKLLKKREREASALRKLRIELAKAKLMQIKK
uniref:Regulatory protein zeste n=1 Tax=Zeugodacus cucurbitae TaxID=28588 RepID=A0A0A1X5I0_ZEUCU